MRDATTLPPRATPTPGRRASTAAGACLLAAVLALTGAAASGAPALAQGVVSAASVSVDAENARNGFGITDDGASASEGIDRAGYTLSREDLAAQGAEGGASIPFGETGVVFTWPAAGQGEADHWIADGQVLGFEGAGPASGISFLGLSTNGATRGTAMVTYTDGSTQGVSLVLSDWVPGNPQAGNSRLIELTKRNTVSGGSDGGRPVVFATAVAELDAGKTVSTVTLPRADEISGSGSMRVFDVALQPITEQEGSALPSRPVPAEATASTIAEAGEPRDLVAEGLSWSFLDTGVDPAEGLPAKTAWTAVDFDDSAWESAAGSFGSRGGQRTALEGGYLPDNLLQQYRTGTTNIEAFFFRTDLEFTAEELADLDQLQGAIVYDDAARVYLNGEPVAGFADSRIDESPTSNLVYAGGNSANPLTGSFSIAAADLVEGVNTLSVQVHNTNAGSSDVYFDLSQLNVISTADPVELTDVVLHVGADETQRNLTYYSDRSIAGQVQIAPASARSGEEFPVEAARTVDASAEPTHDGRFAHKAVLDGLEEDTSYLYRVGNDTVGWSQSSELWTGTFDETYSMVFVGDIQLGASGSASDDAQRWQTTSGIIADRERDASLLLSAGDQVESHSNEFEYSSLLAPEIMQELPFVATIGNHDNQSTAFDSHFNTPNRSAEHGYESSATRSGGDYWFEYNDVLYLNLNSNARSEGEQDHIAFATEVIEERGDSANWIVAIWHHSIYSAAFHSVETDVIERREALAPAMSELGVDLVLSGHDHIYTRSYLMEGTTPVGDLEAQQASGATLAAEEGQVLYVTANSSTGSKYYGLDAGSPDAAVKLQSQNPQYTDVDISPEAITLSTYETYDGSLLDRVTLTHAGADTEAPVFEGLSATVTLQQGEEFDPLAGVAAQDAVDGDLSAQILVEGGVDTALPGDYELRYSVSDAAGNEASFTVTVTVVADGGTGGGSDGGTGGGSDGDGSGQSGERPTGVPAEPAASGAELPAQLQGAVAITLDGLEARVSGLVPDAWYFLYLYSDPLGLGWFQASADGVVTATLPGGLEPGEHRLAVLDENGFLVGWETVLIGGSDGGGGLALSATGATGVTAMVLLALLASGVGTAFLLAARRRAARAA